MNENRIWVFIVAIILAIICAFISGYFLGRSGNNTSIREAQSTIDSLETEVGNLKPNLEIAERRIKELEELQSADRETIDRLAESNRVAEELVKQQRNIINEFEERSTAIETESSEIGTGIGNAINTVDGIIEYIKNREN